MGYFFLFLLFFYIFFNEIHSPGCFGCSECGVTFGDFGYYVREIQVPIKGSSSSSSSRSRSSSGSSGGEVGVGVGENERNNNIKTILKKRPFCRDHSEVTLIGKTLLWLGDWSLNLRRRILCEKIIEWELERGRGKKIFSLLCPIVFSPFDRPLTHKSFFQYRLRR